MMLGAEAAVDWWARALGAVGVASFAWNVYTWRLTNRVSVRAHTCYRPGPERGQYTSLQVTIHNRSAHQVRIEALERQRSWKMGRRWTPWQTETGRIDWPVHGDPAQPVIPMVLPARDQVIHHGADRVLAGTDLQVAPPTETERWRFRVVLDDGHRFVARREVRTPDGRKRWLVWPSRVHRRRGPTY